MDRNEKGKNGQNHKVQRTMETKLVQISLNIGREVIVSITLQKLNLLERRQLNLQDITHGKRQIIEWRL